MQRSSSTCNRLEKKKGKREKKGNARWLCTRHHPCVVTRASATRSIGGGARSDIRMKKHMLSAGCNAINTDCTKRETFFAPRVIICSYLFVDWYSDGPYKSCTITGDEGDEERTDSSGKPVSSNLIYILL